MRALVFLAAVFAVIGAAAFALALTPTIDQPLPTLMVLPSLTPSPFPSATVPASPTPSPTPSRTPPPTDLPLPSPSPTLSQRVLSFTVILPGVVVAPSPTPFPHGTTLLSAPPEPVEPLPDATESAPPFLGWHRFESDHPSVNYQPAWTARQIPDASRGQYHRTERGGSAFFTFEGEALRVRYVTAENIGRFALWLDGVWLDEIDGYAETLTFPVSRIYWVGAGVHRLELRALSGVVGLDAIDVFHAPPNMLIFPPVTATPSPEPIDAARVALVGAPPTLQPTGTPFPPRVLRADVLIAYDENGNRKVDPAEGVGGISVRVVEVSTNRVVASTMTDARGYASFELVSDAPAQIVVPYFGQTWAIQRGSGSAVPSAYTLLLRPGNQPGLIP